MRGATDHLQAGRRGRCISIHAPHARSDVSFSACFLTVSVFQSTLLMRGATDVEADAVGSSGFQSTLLMRGATFGSTAAKAQAEISIHAPHARSDNSVTAGDGRRPHFNPRSSCEERRRTRHSARLSQTFQSTLLMRGATRSRMAAITTAPNFNPRSSCEERLDVVGSRRAPFTISIHAPHARSDKPLSIRSSWGSDFNPRSSCEERPPLMPSQMLVKIISIHAPHARSDFLSPSSPALSSISIHAPHARSDKTAFREFLLCDVFQSTLLMRGATDGILCQLRVQGISIHAPHARSDGAATNGDDAHIISIHAPHARSDGTEYFCTNNLR